MNGEPLNIYVCKLERIFQIYPTPPTLSPPHPPQPPPSRMIFFIFLKSNLICIGNEKRMCIPWITKALDVSCEWAWHWGFCFFNSLGAPVFRSLTLLIYLTSVCKANATPIYKKTSLSYCTINKTRLFSYLIKKYIGIICTLLQKKSFKKIIWALPQ